MPTFVLLFITLTLYYSGFVSAKPEEEHIKKEVLASFERLVHASKKLDVDLYFQHFDTEKFVGLNSDGTNWNSIDDLTPLITNGFKAVKEVKHLEFTNITVSVIDSYTAVLVNEYVQSMELKSGNMVDVAGGGTQVWSKRSGSWKIVSVSASNK